MASWKAKLNFPKASSKATATTSSEIPVDNANEPQPSTSRHMALECSLGLGTSEQATGLAPPPNIKDVPAVRDWLNKKTVSNPEVADQEFVGFLYAERIKTFIDNKWPTWLDDAKTNDSSGRRSSRKRSAAITEPGPDLCMAYALAMAGFMYCTEEKEVKCFVCHRRKNVNEFSNITDPWEAHKEMFSECPLIKLGKRAKPDEYNLNTVLMLMGECEALRLEYEYLQLEKRTQEMLEELDQEEE